MKSNKALIIVVAVILVAAAAGGWFYMKRNNPTGPGGTPQTAVNLPDDWPKDLPFHPSAKFERKTSYGDDGNRYDFKVTLKDAEARTYYEQALRESGWVPYPGGSGEVTKWMKPGRLIGLSVVNTGPESNVAFMIYKDPPPPPPAKPKIFSTGLVQPDGSITQKLPADVPAHPDMTFKGADRTNGDNPRYTFDSKVPYDALTKYYQKTMAEQGWSMWADTTVKSGAHPIFQEIYTKDKYKVAVRIRPGNPCEVVYIFFAENVNLPNIEVTQKGEIPITKGTAPPKDPNANPEPEPKPKSTPKG